MAQVHRVYFLGNLTRNPEVRYAPNGMAVARYGVAVPTRIRQGDTWHADVCCIDVVAFGHQAETVGASLRKGRGVLIEGCLRWRRWKQEGQSHRTREVIAERIQCLSRPRLMPCRCKAVEECREAWDARHTARVRQLSTSMLRPMGKKRGEGSRGRSTARDAHQGWWYGGKARGVEQSALWSAHAAMCCLGTPLLSLPA